MRSRVADYKGSIRQKKIQKDQIEFVDGQKLQPL
jgi:hypothetical protein